MTIPGVSKVCDFIAKHAPANAMRVWSQRTKGVTIGEHVYLGYDVTIDPAMPSLVEIGDHARIGPGVIIMAHERPADAWLPHLGEQSGRVAIKAHAALYPGVIVMPGVTVGAYAIVRAGAVVEDDVPPFSVVAGVPAHVVQRLPEDKVEHGGRVNAMSKT